MHSVYLQQLELLTPGLEGWCDALPFLQGQPFCAPTETSSAYKPQLLPPNERRRATKLTRLAFALGELFLKRNQHSPPEYWQSVFASSGGDYQIIDAMCRDLACDTAISPTQFHNSVHNAVAGYWSIATGGQLASTSISAFEHTLAAGLFEAAVWASCSDAPVFLCAYDAPPPQLLAALSSITTEFSTGLLLSGTPGKQDVAKLSIALAENTCASVCQNPSLEKLRLTNPAARILPLAEFIANKQNGSFVLPFNSQYLIITVEYAC
ncbi:MAG TPA: beta-ketoacyl synthase chain length factor [Cellvibrionaceae bacterium]